VRRTTESRFSQEESQSRVVALTIVSSAGFRILQSHRGHMETERRRLVFDPKPIPVDRTWGFEMTLPDNERDLVSGFFSEAEALAWLASPQCDDWLQKRGYFRDKN
jgi:hypothetical protein